MPRLVAAGSIVLALAAGVDLHLGGAASSDGHGLLDNGHGPAEQTVLVAVEACPREDAQHVDAAESQLSRSCPVCLRNLERRAWASPVPSVVAALDAPRAVYTHEPLAATNARFAPISGRGPPLA